MVTTRSSSGSTPIKATSPSSPTSTPRSRTTAKPPSEPTPPTAMSTPPLTSPYLPTPLETLLLALFPLTLIMGSLFSHFSPTTHPPRNTSVYSTAHQSFQPGAAAPSYFARKGNIFNVYFVKVGWFWTTLALAIFSLSQERARRRRSSSASPTPLQHAQTAARYAVATALWLLTTQWCFGPALIDRNFALTGGACVPGAATPPLDLLARSPQRMAAANSRLSCKVAGGVWDGGHDISGHVFLLVLGSGMLWLEMLPVLLAWVDGLGAGRVVRRGDGGVERLAVEEAAAAGRKGKEAVKVVEALGLGTRVALGVAVLSWWMLLMTAAFFHTWFEKLTGLLVALTGLYIIYFLPRAVPVLRAVVGMPGT